MTNIILINHNKDKIRIKKRKMRDVDKYLIEVSLIKPSDSETKGDKNG